MIAQLTFLYYYLKAKQAIIVAQNVLLKVNIIKIIIRYFFSMECQEDIVLITDSNLKKKFI